MEDSEVLNTKEVTPTDGPIQQDVEPVQDSAPQVLEQNTSSGYANAKAPTTPVVAEKDHTKDILNNQEAAKTYGYTSQEGKNYDKTVTTTTTQSNSASLSATWDSEYKMNSKYAAKEGEDYSWNKLAAEMAQGSYDQEAAQARYESIQAKQELDKAASSAWNEYFASEYSARQTQDKMGWSGGQKTASELQVAFLQAETASNMYTQDEMQKYGVETKLGIARMYADAQQKTLALQYYQDAVDQAIKEAEQTGWYVPPEASEMMKQQEVANKILKDPKATASEKARARKANANCEKYYDSLGFQKGTVKDKNGKTITTYRGIKTLANLTYEETVRNNKVNEKLQRQANDIARSAAGAAWASVEVQEANLQLGISMQNQINNSNITKAIQEGKGTSGKLKSNGYILVDGKKQSVSKGSTTYTLNGNTYIKKNSKTGAVQYYPVYK